MSVFHLNRFSYLHFMSLTQLSNQSFCIHRAKCKPVWFFPLPRLSSAAGTRTSSSSSSRAEDGRPCNLSCRRHLKGAPMCARPASHSSSSASSPCGPVFVVESSEGPTEFSGVTWSTSLTLRRSSTYTQLQKWERADCEETKWSKQTKNPRTFYCIWY